jgi:hypothetical protein
MTATLARARTPMNQRVELARYTITAGARVIYGQRVLGVVRLVDAPAGRRGRRYVIERELTAMAELEAIVADYLQQSGDLGRDPSCRPVRTVLRAQGEPVMTDIDDLEGWERHPLSEQDLAIAALVGRYVERRERGEAPCAHDLLAVAGEFGEVAVAKLRTVLAVYETLLASEDSAG